MNSNNIFIKKKFKELIVESVKYIISSIIFEKKENISKKSKNS